MVIYNVTIKVNSPVVADWITWMKEEHLPDLMATGLFADARLCHLLQQEEGDGETFAAQYYCNSIAEYDTYIDKYANGMREKANQKFGGQFVAFRTLMEII
jgi:hypothetical protein